MSNTANKMPWQKEKKKKKTLLKSSRKWAAIWVITPKRQITSFKSVAAILKRRAFVSDRWMQNHFKKKRTTTTYKAGTTSKFWLIPNSPNHDLQKGERDFENFENIFFFFSNTICPVGENDDCLHAKFASALATLMWHFMKIAMEEVGRNLFWFLRVFIFNHVRTMLNPPKGAHGRWKCLIFNLC